MLPINEIINSYYIDNEETLLRVLKQIKNIKKGNIKYPCILSTFKYFVSEGDYALLDWVSGNEFTTFVLVKEDVC